MITIMVFTLSFTIYLMYYGPLMFLEYYHLNVYISAIVITSSDMLVYPLFYCYVEKMHRKKWAFIFFGVATACSIALAFMHGNEN
jgi:drug/metabolite transporter (DMT)-like permease